MVFLLFSIRCLLPIMLSTLLRLYLSIYLSISLSKMEPITRVQILDESVCIFHTSNTIKKSMNLIFLFQFWVNNRTTWVLCSWLDNQSWRRKIWFQTTFILFKFDLVSLPACTGSVGLIHLSVSLCLSLHLSLSLSLSLLSGLLLYSLR